MSYGFSINNKPVLYNDGDLFFLENRLYEGKNQAKNFTLYKQDIIDYWRNKTGVLLSDVVVIGSYFEPIAHNYNGLAFTTARYNNGNYDIRIGNAGIGFIQIFGKIQTPTYGMTINNKPIIPNQFFKKHKCTVSSSGDTLILSQPNTLKKFPDGFIIYGNIQSSTQYVDNNRKRTTIEFNYKFGEEKDYLPVTTDAIIGGNLVSTYYPNQGLIFTPLQYQFGTTIYGENQSVSIIKSHNIEAYLLEQIPPMKGNYGLEIDKTNNSINDLNYHYANFKSLKHRRFTLRNTKSKQYIGADIKHLVYAGIPMQKDDGGFFVVFDTPQIMTLDIIYIP